MILGAKLTAWLLAAFLSGFSLLHIVEPAVLTSDPPYPTLTDVAPRVAFWLLLAALLVASTLANRVSLKRFLLAGLLSCPFLAAFLAAGAYGIAGTAAFSAVYAGMATPGIYLTTRAV